MHPHVQSPGGAGRCHHPGPARSIRFDKGIGGGQIEVAIAIEVAYRDGVRRIPTPKSWAALKVPSPWPSKIDTVAARIGGGQIGVAIAIEVTHRDGERTLAHA